MVKIGLALAGSAMISLGSYLAAATGIAGPRIDAATYAQHMAEQHRHADLDGNGYLDADEFSTLELVTAELARLNRFVVVAGERDETVITLGRQASEARFTGLSKVDRIEIDATARNVFYRHAGADLQMSAEEFQHLAAEEFADADLNRDTVLTRREARNLAMTKAAKSFSNG